MQDNREPAEIVEAASTIDSLRFEVKHGLLIFSWFLVKTL